MRFFGCDDEHGFFVGLERLVQAVEEGLERALIAERLGDGIDRPLLQAAQAVVFGADDPDRDMPRGSIFLQPAQHAIAFNIGQVQIERDRRAAALAATGDTASAPRSADHDLEALFVGRVQQDSSEAQIVFDD